MEHLISPGAKGPGAGADAAGKATPRMVELDKLPPSVRGILAFLPEKDWYLVHAAICHTGIAREMVVISALLDRVWTESKSAEDSVRDRLTGAERDAFRSRVDQALKELVSVSVELGKRAHLTGALQHNRLLIERYLPDAVPKPGPKPSARRTDQPRKAPQAPDLLNRWLSGIRRIRESDAAFARAKEVLSMFEKALECAGGRRAEVEQQLAQYQEVMKNAGEGAAAPPAPATIEAA